MEKQIKNYLNTVQLGEPQSYHNLVLFPLQAPQNGVLSYDWRSKSLFVKFKIV